MDKRIYKLLENKVNDYKASIGLTEFGSNDAIFSIFDTFLHTLIDNKKKSKEVGVEFITAITTNVIASSFDVGQRSWNKEGIGFLLKIEGVQYTIRFRKYRDGQEMRYYIGINNNDEVNYPAVFIYEYLMFCALETSKLKGSYFTMPRDSFSWEIKDMEVRTFDDIFLPNDIIEDLHLYVDIYKLSDSILRYLKVGNPGVGKTESTLVLASELNKLGVTIIKTTICECLHQKVELANVLAPAVIVFDDIDLSLGDRNHGSYSKLLGDFLDVLDGTDKLGKNVGVIATTNAAHLLDLAAQRPGRFDKTLLYDDITKNNVKNIIIKSLKLNFNLTKGKEFDVYTDDRIVSKFYDSGVSGSHIFNAIKMIKLRYDTLKIKTITVDKIIGSITSDLKVIEKTRKLSHVKEKYDRSEPSIGFGRSNSNYGGGEMIEEISYDEPSEGEPYNEEAHEVRRGG